MKKFEGYLLTELELGQLGETMVELSYLCYNELHKFIHDHTEVAVLIRDAAINFENKGIFWDAIHSDYYTELEKYAQTMIRELKEERGVE